jgi:hypothetical protein
MEFIKEEFYTGPASNEEVIFRYDQQHFVTRPNSVISRETIGIPSSYVYDSIDLDEKQCVFLADVKNAGRLSPFAVGGSGQRESIGSNDRKTDPFVTEELSEYHIFDWS